MSRTSALAFSLAAIGIGLLGCAAPPSAPGYRFELVDPQPHPSRDGDIQVRLVRLRDNQPVAGATIYEHRFEMWMSGYKTVTTTMVEGASAPPVLSIDDGGGIYRVHARVPMAGNWQATFVARVPGETLPVRESFRMQVR